MKRILSLGLSLLFLLTLVSCQSLTAVIPEEEIPQKEAAAADYSDLYAAISEIPEDVDLYTKQSYAALQAEVDAVRYGLTQENQAEVDATAQNIRLAIAALEEKISFDSLSAIIEYVDGLGLDFSDLASFSMDGYFEDTVLPETADAGQEYLDETYYIGDSITLYMHRYATLPKENIYGVGSINPQNAAEDKLVTLDNGVKVTFAEAMGKKQPKRVVITIGTNSMLMDSIDYLTYFDKLIRDIKEESPDTQIILQSTSPLTAEYEKNMRLLTNRNINRSNMLLAGLAVYEDVYFLNSAEALKDASGTLDTKFDLGEGYGHINADAYAVWESYLRTHAIEE